MNYKNNLLIAITGYDPQENMGSNPLMAQAREIERQQEQADREQETKYGTAISNSFKKPSK